MWVRANREQWGYGQIEQVGGGGGYFHASREQMVGEVEGGYG